MKKLLFFLLFIASVTTNAATVWWVHSFSDRAVVHDDDGTYSITEYAENVLGDSLYNVAYMIRDVASGTYLDFEYPGYKDFVNYDYKFNWAEGTGDGYPYIRNNQVSIGDENNLPDELMVELHLYDEENDSFTKFAISDIFTLDDLDHALYHQSGLGPDADVPTEFVDFYTDDYSPVPEPSTTAFLIIGVAVLLLGRKRG